MQTNSFIDWWNCTFSIVFRFISVSNFLLMPKEQSTEYILWFQPFQNYLNNTVYAVIYSELTFGIDRQH